MTERELHEALRLRRAHPPHERLEQARPGAPRQMKAGDGVAVTAAAGAAALRPARIRQHPNAHPVQPVALLVRRKLHVGPGPAPRPLVLGTIERSAPQPVLPGKLERVTDPDAPLLGRIDQEQSTQRPERLTSDRSLGLLVDQQHPPSGVHELHRGGQSGETRSDNDHVGLERSCFHRPIPSIVTV